MWYASLFLSLKNINNCHRDVKFFAYIKYIVGVTNSSFIFLSGKNRWLLIESKIRLKICTVKLSTLDTKWKHCSSSRYKWVLLLWNLIKNILREFWERNDATHKNVYP